MHTITEVDFIGTRNVLWESKDEDDTRLTLYPTYVLDDADGVTLGAGLRLHVAEGVCSTVLDVNHMRAMAAFLTLSADRMEAGEHVITTRVAQDIAKLRS